MVRNDIRFVDTRTLDSASVQKTWMLENKGDSGNLFVVFLLSERKDRRERKSVIFLLRGKW